MAATTMPKALAALTLALAASACGTSDPTPAAAPSTTTTIERPSALVDDTFAVDGGMLHLHCDGNGPTTLLLIAGWGAGGDEAWASVFPALAEETRVCTYDRFGTGASDTPASTQTFRTEAAGLEALLETAGEPGPYVVVGHSFGGAEAVTFADEQRAQVTGLVLVDASPTSWPAEVCAVPDDGTQAARDYQQLCGVMHDPALDAERLDVIAAFEDAAGITTLGDLPLTIVTAAHRTSPGLAPTELARLDAAWSEGTSRWAELSTSSSIVPVEDTSHQIQIDHPDLIIEQVTQLLP